VTVANKQQKQPAPQEFRVRLAGILPDREEENGVIWRTHTFHLVDDQGNILVQETEQGPMPIVLMSLPIGLMRRKVMPHRGAPIILPGNALRH
jgi:hypothetical protein